MIDPVAMVFVSGILEEWHVAEDTWRHGAEMATKRLKKLHADALEF
jgi:hypothetical protein